MLMMGHLEVSWKRRREKRVGIWRVGSWGSKIAAKDAPVIAANLISLIWFLVADSVRNRE